MPDDKYDEIFYQLCTFFNEYNFYEISFKLLQFIINKTTIKYQIEQANILLFREEYDNVIQLTNEIAAIDKTKSET